MRSKAHKHIAWALFNHFCLEKGNNRSLIRSYNSGTYGRALVRQLFRFAAPFIQISVLLQWQEDNEVDLLIVFFSKNSFWFFFEWKRMKRPRLTFIWNAFPSLHFHIVTISLLQSSQPQNSNCEMSIFKLSIQQLVNVPGLKALGLIFTNPAFLLPDFHLKTLRDLDLHALRTEHKIECLVFDKDNTLR